MYIHILDHFLSFHFFKYVNIYVMYVCTMYACSMWGYFYSSTYSHNIHASGITLHTTTTTTTTTSTFLSKQDFFFWLFLLLVFSLSVVVSSLLIVVVVVVEVEVVSLWLLLDDRVWKRLSWLMSLDEERVLLVVVRTSRKK